MTNQEVVPAKRKAEVFEMFKLFNKRDVRDNLNRVIAEARSVTIKEAKDCKVVRLNEVEKMKELYG